ncbi:MAG: hypothetical protein AAFQ22_04960 [Pseudomonadota bacterium]
MAQDDTLNETRIIELIQTYGADLSAWPEGLADTAQMYLDNPTPAIARAMAEEAELDSFLSTMPDIEAPDHLYSAILEAAPKSLDANRRSGMPWSLAGWRTRFAACASALAMGLTIGLGTAAASAPSDDPFSESSYLGFDPTLFAEGLEEVSE